MFEAESLAFSDKSRDPVSLPFALQPLEEYGDSVGGFVFLVRDFAVYIVCVPGPGLYP